MDVFCLFVFSNFYPIKHEFTHWKSLYYKILTFLVQNIMFFPNMMKCNVVQEEKNSQDFHQKLQW